ncbi:sensor histidine kinase [Streptosporangium sp. G12]
MPATDRPWLRVRALLAWAGACAYPFALALAVQAGPYRSAGLRLFLSAAATLLPIALLRRSPVAALALMLAGMVAAAATRPYPELLYLSVLATDVGVGHIVANRPRRIAFLAAGMTLAVQIGSATYLGVRRDVFVGTVVVLVLALITVWMSGRAVRERREHAAELRARTAAEAVTGERLRIARELHDVIAHSIGIIAIQAGVGRRVFDTQPAEARNALATIENTSRDALSGLRRTLVALRRPQPGTPPPSAAEAASLDPAPGLADLDRLVAATRDAGVRVEVRRLGERRSLPAEVDLAAFRIVQEALTNVLRHADACECRVTIGYRDGEVRVEVEDDGRGGRTGGTGGLGHGIVGMRERVNLLCGEFTAGPRPGGGFRVTARLPLSEGAHVP